MSYLSFVPLSCWNENTLEWLGNCDDYCRPGFFWPCRMNESWRINRKVRNYPYKIQRTCQSQKSWTSTKQWLQWHMILKCNYRSYVPYTMVKGLYAACWCTTICIVYITYQETLKTRQVSEIPRVMFAIWKLVIFDVVISIRRVYNPVPIKTGVLDRTIRLT